MGFYNSGVGPWDWKDVLTLQPVIVQTLRKAALALGKGDGRAESPG